MYDQIFLPITTQPALNNAPEAREDALLKKLSRFAGRGLTFVCQSSPKEWIVNKSRDRNADMRDAGNLNKRRSRT